MSRGRRALLLGVAGAIIMARDSATAQTQSYIESLRALDRLPDSFVLALERHPNTPDERMIADVLAFHGDVGNGGLAQALSNLRGDVRRIIRGLATLKLMAGSDVVSDADALYRSLQSDALSDNPWERYLNVLSAAKPRWDALDIRYLSATRLNGPGRDLVEHAALAYVVDHASGFETAVKWIGVDAE